MKKIIVSIFVYIFLLSLVFAQQARVQVQPGIYSNEFGEQIRVQMRENAGAIISAKNVEAKTELVMTQEQVANKTLLRVQLSNGRDAEVKIMPDVASERAIEVLNSRCEQENCTIELKEVGVKNQTNLAYEVKTQKQTRILGLFRAQMQIQAHIDAETGETIRTKKPWWSFLAIE